MDSLRAGVLCLLAAAFAIYAERVARADEASEDVRDHTIIVGVGGAGELELGNGSLHPGVNVMVEWDAIEDWLELELEASALAADQGLEIPVALLVKKPFSLGRRAEFMVGLGPEVVRVTGPNRGTYFGGEAALDFMFWPWSRQIGLWVEPEYDLTLHDGASSGVGATGGVLLGW